MKDLPLASVYTWRHRESNNSAIPVHARSIKNGVALQYLDGTVRIYQRTWTHENPVLTEDDQIIKNDKSEDSNSAEVSKISFMPITSIIGDIGGYGSLTADDIKISRTKATAASNMSFGAAAHVSAIEVSRYDTPEGDREAIFVSRAGGMIRKYDIPSGRLLAQGKLPFECRGLNAHMNKKILIAWGYSCEMVVLDQNSLKIKGRWTSLPDWPLPTSLFEDQILVFFKSGMASYWKIYTDRETYETVEQIKQPHPMIRLPPPPSPKVDHVSSGQEKGSFEPKFLKSRKQSVITMFDRSHGFDPLITVKQVSDISWVVARRHGWMLYKWEDGTLVDEISADVSEGIVSIITVNCIESLTSTSFGILTRSSTIIWVSDGNVQVVEPIWNVKNDEIITCAVYSMEENLLSSFVVTEYGIDVYHAHTDAWPVAWDPVPFRLQTFKKTTEYVSSVIGNDVVIGRGHDLILFSPEMFLGSSEEYGKLLYSLDSEHRVTTLECTKENNDQYLIAAGTSDGKLIEVNAKTAKVELSVKLFASAVTRIIRLSKAASALYENFILAVSVNSSVTLVDRSKGTVWKHIPSNDLNIISIAFTTQNPCWIVIEYEDRQRRIWDLDTDEEVDDLTFYASLVPTPQSDKMSVSSLSSMRRNRFDQTQKNKELDKLENILLLKVPLTTQHSSLLISPPSYSRSPLMVIRNDVLIEQFSQAMSSGDHEMTEKLSSTVRAVCSSMFHVPRTDNMSSFHEFVVGLCPINDTSHEELGVGLLSSVFLESSSPILPVAFDLTLFCMHKKAPTTLLEIDGETSSAVIVMWISLVQLLAQYYKVEVPPFSEIYKLVSSIKGIKEPNILGLARVLLTRKGLLYENAKQLLLETIRTADMGTVLSTWRPYLFQISKEEFGEFTKYAMLILSALSLHCNDEKINDQMTGMSRDVAQRLASCLDDTRVDENIRMLAIQLIGQGWDLWQKFVNPFGVLQSLIDLLYKNGFIAPSDAPDANPPSVLSNENTGELDKSREELISRCRQSIREIAMQNSTLLVSVLSIYIRSPEHLVDARIAALRLLTSFITNSSVAPSKNAEDALITEVHLPTIISTVVHLLEPANAATREVSATGGVSLVNEITQFLSKALAQYPSSLAFHKNQQRLAVSLIGTHNGGQGMDSSSILGFVYDLRSGTAMATLSVHAGGIVVSPPALNEPEVDIFIGPGTSQLGSLVFAPDGKHLAGLLDVQNNKPNIKIVAVWKIGFGFMSLLQNLTLSLPSSTPSAATSPYPGGTPPSNNSSGSSPTMRSTSPANNPSHRQHHNLHHQSSLNVPGGVAMLSSSSIPSTPAVVVEDQAAANRFTVYPKLLKALRLPTSDCSIKWISDKAISVKSGPNFTQELKISQ